MANKFLIENLSSASTPLLSTDFAIVENSSTSTTYKIDMQSMYKDVLSNRLKFEVGRKNKKTGANVLSLYFNNDDSSSSYLTSVSLQDGILSTVKFDSETNVLSLYFSFPGAEPSDLVSVDLNSLKDVYTAGYGLGVSSISQGNEFYVDVSAINELSTLSTCMNSSSVAAMFD